MPKLLAYADAVDAVSPGLLEVRPPPSLRAIRVQVGLGDTMDVLDSSRREADRSTHTDDLVALEAVAALHPEAATFEAWLRELLARPPVRAGRAFCCRRSTRSRAASGSTSSSTARPVGLLPHRLSDDEEGERRVFHVALTRAIRQVVVLADADGPSPFVAELDGSQSPPADRPGRRSRPQTPARSRGIRSARRVAAGSGAPEPRWRRSAGARGSKQPRGRCRRWRRRWDLRLDYAGHSGTVVGTVRTRRPCSRWARRGWRCAFGSEVRVQGATVVLTAPGEAAEGAGAAESYEQALRAWRSGVAKREAVPAYVVLNDNELAGLATRRPRTLAELARLQGHRAQSAWSDGVTSSSPCWAGSRASRSGVG